MSLFGCAGNDVDKVLLKNLYVTRDYLHLLKTNRYYWKLVTTNPYFVSWKKLLTCSEFVIYSGTNENEDLFINACRKGLIIRTCLLIEKPNINIHACDELAFSLSCFYSKYQTVKWLLTIGPQYGYINIYAQGANVFHQCTNTSSQKILNLLLSQYNNPFFGKCCRKDFFKTTFVDCCHQNMIRSIKKIYSLDQQQDKSTIVLTNEMFINACEKGYYNLAKWLLEESRRSKRPINIHAKSDKAIEKCIEHKRIRLVKWLIDLTVRGECGPFDNLNLVFRDCCRHGMFSTAKLLIDLSTKKEIDHININNLFDYAFRFSCANGYLDIAKWLLTLSQNPPYKLIDIHAKNEFAFYESCARGQFDVVKWLIDISINPKYGYINIHTMRNAAIKKSYNKGNYHITKFLMDLSSDHRYGNADNL